MKFLKDFKTNEVLALHVYYSTDIPPIGLIGDRLSDYKFWMQKNGCNSGNYDLSKKFNSLIQRFTRER
jgi:hypothetical protein